MNKYTKYVISTLLYGIVGLAGIQGVIYFSVQKEWLLVLISFLIVLVAADNFFCAKRAKVFKKTKKHYTIPPFLKK